MGLEEKDTVLDAVGFRMAERIPDPGDLIDVVYTPVLDTWRGVEKIKLMVKDFMQIS